MSYYGVARSIPDQSNSFTSAEVALEVRQHPVNALVTPENKEKARKPIDPPPIVQLRVNSERHRDWLVNPFLFMNAVLVHADDEHGGQPKTLPGNQLLGQNVSSLHRLKDINNKDGGFFVFGDISCRRTGTYRLQFNLFNYEDAAVNFLGSAVSNQFRVMTAKEYPGLQESTHLSRTFSDQGVRLRLRKENRNGGVKRTYTAAATSEVYDVAESRPSNNAYGGGPVRNDTYDQQGRGYIKRQRSDSEYTSPHGYPAYGSSAMQPYAMPTNTPYGQHLSQPSQSEHQAQMGSMMTPMHQGMIPGWQRSQGPYSAPVGGPLGIGGGSYFGSAVSSGQTPRALNYAQQASPQYGVRGQSEIYSGISSLPTPVSEQSVPSAQSSIAGYSQPSQLSAALPSRGQPVQHYDLSSPSAQYPPQPQHYSQTSPQYQSAPSNVGYEQQPAPNPIKMEGQAYGDSPNLYNAPQQNTYPVTESFSNNNLPLSSGMLNREFSGAYQEQSQGQEQGAYAEMPESDLSGYQAKSQSSAYPTPHQTSPQQPGDQG